MSERPPSSKGRRVTTGVAAAATAAAVLLVVGVVALVLGLQGTPGPSQSAASQALPGRSGPPAAKAPVSPGRGGTPTAGPSRPLVTPPATSARGAGSRSAGAIGTFLPASEPTTIEVPSIGLRSSSFVPLGVQRDGTISVPGTAQEVGLYDAGPTPGQLGPSVLAAHVDTPSGVPGIFAKLREVRVGDLVKVARRDGSRLTFTVDRVKAYPKTQFPTDLVYRSTFTAAEIRLVTCGGPTDSRNEYRDNVVVFGHLTNAT